MEEKTRDFYKRFRIHKTKMKCNSPVPPDREEAPAWQRQPGQGAARDSWSCLGIVNMDREWGLLGRDKPEQEPGEVLGPIGID